MTRMIGCQPCLSASQMSVHSCVEDTIVSTQSGFAPSRSMSSRRWIHHDELGSARIMHDELKFSSR
jgi:hypothetical protein